MNGASHVQACNFDTGDNNKIICLSKHTQNALLVLRARPTTAFLGRVQPNKLPCEVRESVVVLHAMVRGDRCAGNAARGKGRGSAGRLYNPPYENDFRRSSENYKLY